MTSGAQLAEAAESLRKRITGVIEANILERASELKPNVVSFGERMTRLLEMATIVVSLAGKKLGEAGHGSAIAPAPAWAASIHHDTLVVTRLRPRYTTIRFSKEADEIVVRTPETVLGFTTEKIYMAKGKMRVEIDPRRPEDVQKHIYEIKYITKGLGKRLTMLSQHAAKAFA